MPGKRHHTNLANPGVKSVAHYLTSQLAAMTVQNVPQKQDKTQLHAAAAEI